MNGKQKTLVALGILFFACVVIWAVRTVPEAPRTTIDSVRMTGPSLRTPSSSGFGASAQPIFHPVTLNVFAALETVTVRSAMPGSEASGVCGASNVSRS